MESLTTNLMLRRMLAPVMSLLLLCAPIYAQGNNPNVKTNTKVVYHDGPVFTAFVNLYLIWYGSWPLNLPGNDGYTRQIVLDFSANIGGKQYMAINQGYPDASGVSPSGAVIYSGQHTDWSYQYGPDLNPLGMQGIVKDAISAGSIPSDSNGIYLIIASSDVASSTTGFCVANTPPYHGSFLFNGQTLKFGFVGNPTRCPTTGAPQLTWPGPTPNDDFSADGIANKMAAVLSAIVTNPTGSGWFDRYGFENSTKCQGSFGPTYAASNTSRANIRIGQRDYLIQQNWVNARKAYCAMAAPTP